MSSYIASSAPRPGPDACSTPSASASMYRGLWYEGTLSTVVKLHDIVLALTNWFSSVRSVLHNVIETKRVIVHAMQVVFSRKDT